MKRTNQHISAFTVMEIVMVLAIMGILITMVFNAISRFQQQAVVSSNLHDELNDWYRFRSQLWSELYFLDSAKIENQQLTLFDQQKVISYKIEQDTLMRSELNTEFISTGFEASELKLDSTINGQELVFVFQWKNEPMELSYYHKADRKKRIDQYFENL